MRLYYGFVMNGAYIKCHDRLQDALAQARQWKAHNLDKAIKVVTLDRDAERGAYQYPLAETQIEIPSLVPELTKRDDFDWLPALAALGVHQW